jgi:UDP-N-acetylglucosamine 2-epimerase (non-hydrolysing)
VTDAVKIDLIVGARPNFMKAGPVIHQLRKRQPSWSVRVIHTGQHYDDRLSARFFRDLDLPEPDVSLNIGSGTQVSQVARTMAALEPEFRQNVPDLVMVFGDVNSTVAGALTAAQMQIPIAHVEAGLRSFDRSMPEEVNRTITDAVAELLFVTEPSALENLAREGVPKSRIHFVGNTMIDTLMAQLPRIREVALPARLGLAPGQFIAVTLHRPSNVDHPPSLGRIVEMLIQLADRRAVVFPVHPRTNARLREAGLLPSLERHPRIHLLEPLGYLEFMSLVADAALVLTDSGGVQEETTMLNVPCVTLRKNTERPITVTAGTNILAGDGPAAALTIVDRILAASARRAPAPAPEKWDGQAASRIVDILEVRSTQMFVPAVVAVSAVRHSPRHVS